MNMRYTLVIQCDGGEEIAQESAATPGKALDQWTRRVSPGGIIESLSTEDRDELRSDFSASDPTIYGIGIAIEGLEGVWRAVTVLASGKHISVVCVQCSEQGHRNGTRRTTRRWRR